MTVSLPTRSRWRHDGEPIEFNGIEPDTEVEAVPDELQKGLNSAILRAEEYIKGRPPSTRPADRPRISRPPERYQRAVVTKDGKLIVPAKAPWTDAGIDLQKVQAITISATGEIHGCRGPKHDWAYGPWSPEGMIRQSGP